MATYNKFQQFIEDLAEQVHDLGADTLRVGLTNTIPVATNTIYGNITEIGAGNGYTAKGESTAQTISAHTTGTYKLTVTDVVWTAAGGTIGPFQYAVFYNDTPAGPVDPLIGWHDYGSPLTLNNGESFTWDQDGAGNGILTLA